MGRRIENLEYVMGRKAKNLEYAVKDASGKECIFDTPDEAAGFAVGLAACTGKAVNLDVLCWTREAAIAYAGDHGSEVYDEDPEASIHERIVIRAESKGRIA